jgi:hypothetical protein
MQKPLYRAKLVAVEGGFEQSFGANVVHVEDELVALGELVPDPKRGLPHGTPVHSLLVHLERGRPTEYELNDQSNAVEAEAVIAVEVGPKALVVRFVNGRGPRPGRVLLSRAIELFRDAKTTAEEQAPLASLRVEYSVKPRVAADLARVLGTTKAPAKKARSR